MVNHYFTNDAGEAQNHRAVRNHVPILTKNDKPFAKEETERAIIKINRGKTPGPDGLPIEIIGKVFLANEPLFTRLLNVCLKKGYFPKAWK